MSAPLSIRWDRGARDNHMSDVAIRAEGLSKQYQIGERQKYKALRDTLTDAIYAPFRWCHSQFKSEKAEDKKGKPTIWALKDVSFEIKQGEVVGVIGRNGAGKSTLLKILSRITEPTMGYAEIQGRVGSLLEVGTGFHPELTGRENVYLNGSIIGMKKRGIDRKFDEIVAFAEIEQFLDTPVKYYSSGMYMRLAFAVAAHLEPEILLVDEVLAVGDATYQRKCINRMSTLSSAGKTVLIVSHNIDLINRFCSKVMLFEHGQIYKEGPVQALTSEYLTRLLNDDPGDLASKTRTGDGRAKFSQIQLVDSNGQHISAHPCGDDLVLRMTILSTCDIRDVALAIVLKTLSGTRLITSWTRETNFSVALQKGSQVYECCFRRVYLRPGHSIGLSLWMESHGVIDSIEDAGSIYNADGKNTQHLSTEENQGIIACECSWARLE